MLTAQEIQQFAQHKGIHAVGWFQASDFDRYRETIQETIEYHHVVYRPLADFLRSGFIPSQFRTVIVVVMDYFSEAPGRVAEYRLSNYSRACWNTVNPKTAEMIEFLKERGYLAEKLDLPQRAAACRAGLGFIGRNAMFYAHHLGSYVGIASIGTDADIENAVPGSERVSHPACHSCQRCQDACPVAAIRPEGYKINPLRCLSFANRHPDEPLRILPEANKHLDGWLQGCEACQNVCPINQKIKHPGDAQISPEIELEGMTIPNLALISREMIETRMNTITSPGFREYVERLIAS